MSVLTQRVGHVAHILRDKSLPQSAGRREVCQVTVTAKGDNSSTGGSTSAIQMLSALLLSLLADGCSCLCPDYVGGRSGCGTGARCSIARYNEPHESLRRVCAALGAGS